MNHDEAASIIREQLDAFESMAKQKYIVGESVTVDAETLRALLDGYEAAVKDMKYASDQRVCSDESEICTICEHNNGQDCGGCWKLDHKEEAL